MPKKLFKIIISIIVIVFSFFYTNKIINIFKDNDPIMIEIKNKEKEYINIENERLDIDKSYQNMKKAGKFDKNLLVFQEIHSKNNYNDYIYSLNKKQNNISIIFVLNDTDNILNILDILNRYEVNATFFIAKRIFDNSIDIVKLISENGNQIELLSDNYSVYEVNKYSSVSKIITKNKLRFCLNINKDNNLLESCESSKLYSIAPNKIINNNLYFYIKNNLSNGLILALDNSNKNIKELSSVIKYILQKGMKIELLKRVIE